MTAASLPSPAELPADVVQLIEQKNFDALEDVWTGRMGEEPENLAFFFAVASAVKKKGGLAMALSWLRFLADYEAERGDGDRQLAVLLEIARMSPADAEIRKELEAALRARFASHPASAAVFAHFPLGNPADAGEAAGKIARWLRFSPGEIYFMPGRGPGRIVELNPDARRDPRRIRRREASPLARQRGDEPVSRCRRSTSCGARSKSPRRPARSSSSSPRKRSAGCSRASAAP